jgi:hypothetical protein
MTNDVGIGIAEKNQRPKNKKQVGRGLAVDWFILGQICN